MSVAVEVGGICNAMAFWFELQLDEEASLSSSPYVDKVPSCFINRIRYQMLSK